MITLGQLKKYIEQSMEAGAKEDTPVDILFETGFCQYQYRANGCVLPSKTNAFILTHELDLLPREEWIQRERDSYKLITRILKDKINREDIGLELEAVANKEIDSFFGKD